MSHRSKPALRVTDELLSTTLSSYENSYKYRPCSTNRNNIKSSPHTAVVATNCIIRRVDTGDSVDWFWSGKPVRSCLSDFSAGSLSFLLSREALYSRHGTCSQAPLLVVYSASLLYLDSGALPYRALSSLNKLLEAPSTRALVNCRNAKTLASCLSTFACFRLLVANLQQRCTIHLRFFVGRGAFEHFQQTHLLGRRTQSIY